MTLPPRSLMDTILIAAGAAALYIIAYHTYGRWLSRKIFRLDPAAIVPSQALRDDRDFVPTPKSVIFGHHFTSIAGTGPIVGPTLAVIWGWVPALLWVVFGSIFMGAVHDLGSLVVSLRSQGMTVGEIAGRVLNPRVRLLFLCILLFALWLVLAIFGLVIANVFSSFPACILPVFLQIPIAVWIGMAVHRKGKNILLPSIIALALMYITVWFGAGCPGVAWEGGAMGAAIQSLNASLASWPIWLWTAILLAYCFAASVLPVWSLLQPRDYINSLQLISSLGLIVAGLVAAGLATSGAEQGGLAMFAPAVRLNPEGAPPFMPFLFITIACGAISGFHCLVSSGTTSKQIKSEPDAQFVGYGSMLTEGFLATVVLLAVAGGLGMGWPSRFPGLEGAELWNAAYADWASVKSFFVEPFVIGAGNFIQALGISPVMATAIVAVLVASFAGTTLDTATRLQRYVVQELAETLAPKSAARSATNPIAWFRNPYVATFFAVATAFALALFPAPGKPWSWETIGTGGLTLWPIFGAMNQLLAGLAFMVICFWLMRRNAPIWFAAIPAVIMLVLPGWALGWSIFNQWLPNESYLLIAVGIGTLILEAWMIIEALLLLPRVKGINETDATPTPATIET